MTKTFPEIDIKKIPYLYFYHPLTIVVLLIFDWGGFVFEVPQIISPLTLFFTFFIIFFISTFLAYLVQINFAGETKLISFVKSIIAGIICAIPTGLMTSIVGTIILTLSGFNSYYIDGFKGLSNMFNKRNAD